MLLYEVLISHVKSVPERVSKSKSLKCVFDVALNLVAYISLEQAIHKTRWVIATRAGGIPLQIRDGVDGKLVPPNNPKAIAEAMIEFYTSEKDKCKTAESRGNYTDRPLGGRWTDEGEGPREELFSIGNATMWHVSTCVTPINSCSRDSSTSGTMFWASIKSK